MTPKQLLHLKARLAGYYIWEWWYGHLAAVNGTLVEYKGSAFPPKPKDYPGMGMTNYTEVINLVKRRVDYYAAGLIKKECDLTDEDWALALRVFEEKLK